MTQSPLSAEHAVITVQKGFAVGSGVSGAVLLLATVGVLGDPVPALVSTAISAVVFGVLYWLLSRRAQRRTRLGLPMVTAPEGPDAGFRAGLRMAGLLGIVELALMLGFAWLLGAEAAYSIPTVLLGLTLALVLSLRDLRRWQYAAGLELFTRAGSRRAVWTRSQARDRLVVVSAGADDVV